LKGPNLAMQEKITLAGIRLKCKSSREKVRFQKDNLLDYYVFTRVSYYPTWLFLKSGISANQASAISILVASSGCILLAPGLYPLTILGVILISTGILLDNVDGNIARYNGTCSKYGEFLEALSEYIIIALLFSCASIGLYNHPDLALGSLSRLILGVNPERTLYIILGIWASFFFIFTYLVADRFGLVFSQKPHELYQPKTSVRGVWGIIYKVGINLQSTSGLMLPLLVLAAVFKLLSIFVFLYALTATAGFIAVLSRTLLEASKFKYPEERSK